MVSRKSAPPTLSISTSTSSTTSPERSPRSSSTQDFECDADDEATMSSEDYAPSRPLSVTIPSRQTVQGPYCIRRPNLSEVLANTAEPPYTLSAFMAYLSHNHCLETLEFTMDASRYRKHYNKMISRGGNNTPPSIDSDECAYVKMLWQKLLEAYIRPNGAREVNLPCNVRDHLLSLANPELPPSPSTLDPAVEKVYELMEESVLVPFLNSMCPQTSHPDSLSSEAYNTSDENLQALHMRSFDERQTHRYSRKPSPPPNTAIDGTSFSYSPSNTYQHRVSAPSSLTSSLTRAASKHLSRASHTSTTSYSHGFTHAHNSAMYSSSGDALTDDSGSMSPLADPMTPPTTPPMSDYGASSPRTSRDINAWKKMSSKLAWKKKSAGTLREEEVYSPLQHP